MRESGRGESIYNQEVIGSDEGCECVNNGGGGGGGRVNYP